MRGKKEQTNNMNKNRCRDRQRRFIGRKINEKDEIIRRVRRTRNGEEEEEVVEVVEETKEEEEEEEEQGRQLSKDGKKKRIRIDQLYTSILKNDILAECGKIFFIIKLILEQEQGLGLFFICYFYFYTIRN